MSLRKQLLAFITLIFSIIFLINFLVSVNNVKSYLEVESETHMQDTATSLGLSLSPYMGDENDPILRTMMNAIFDTGYYQEMRLTDIENQDLIVLENPTKVEGVPDWLIHYFPMKSATAISEINSGWSISGKLYITANPGFAYLKLYQQAKESLKFSLIAFLGSVVFLYFAFSFMLKSLFALEQQAKDISEANFTLIEKMPWTLEIRAVTQSMNSMSSKIGSMIKRLNDKLDRLSENLKRDPLTHLLNQTTFEENLKQALDSSKSGYIALVKFDDLAHIAREKGNKVVDELLIELSLLLNRDAFNDSQAYRLYGSEFSLLTSEINHNQMIKMADTLSEHIDQFAEQYELNDIIHIGIVRFERNSEFTRIIPAMQEAYEQAKLIGQNSYYIKQNSTTSMTDIEWKALIADVINSEYIDITLTTDAYNYSENTPIKVMQEAFTVIKDKNTEIAPVGTFFSMAEEFGLEQSLDKVIINNIIKLMEANNQTTPVTINLSLSAVRSPRFHEWLTNRLQQSLLSNDLYVFSLAAYAASKDIPAFTEFSQFVKSIGAQVLLKRYSSDIIDIDTLKGLKPNYLRLCRDLTTDIADSNQKIHFLDLIHEVTSLLDIKVLAEGVSNDADLNLVRLSGIYGASK